MADALRLARVLKTFVVRIWCLQSIRTWSVYLDGASKEAQALMQRLQRSTQMNPEAMTQSR